MNATSSAHSPPRPVKYGNNLTDEMVSCNLEVVVETRADLKAIQAMREFQPRPAARVGKK